MPSFDELELTYRQLWDSMVINPSKAHLVEVAADKISSGKARYQSVARFTGVPWFVVGIIHSMESDCDFSCHLHNGDSLSMRTVHVPRGRPPEPLKPPFKWEDSAADALQVDRLDDVKVWSIERIAYELELYNGFGYRGHGINTPYLWSFTNHYSAGKYVADGVWSSSAVSSECGAMAVLYQLMADDKSILAGLSPSSNVVATSSSHSNSSTENLANPTWLQLTIKIIAGLLKR
jgi:lysozyme family protein